MIKVAYGSVPKDGGTFTFFRNMRPLLLEHGIELTCVTVGRDQKDITDPKFVTEGCVQLAPASNSLKAQAQAFESWYRSEGIDIVFGVNSPGILSAIPHLPEGARVLARCANGFDEGYKLTLIGRERLMRIVALTPRLKDDLVSKYQVAPEDVVLIPNGAEQSRFDPTSRTPSKGETLKLAFLGRLEHNQKGVLHLPPVLEDLDANGIDYHIEIAGRGKDEAELRDKLKSQIESGRVKFVGTLAPEEIPGFLTRADVYLFPSHFEGCPNALLEAMMAGTVPVAWQLHGITDFLIKDGQTGLLAETSNTKLFAEKIATLAKGPAKLERMRNSLLEDAQARFTTQTCKRAYVDFFQQIMGEKPAPIAPKEWSQFQPDPMFKERFINRLMPAKSRAALKSLYRHTKRQFGAQSHV